MFWIAWVLCLTGVAGADLSAWCETDPDGCSDYCEVNRAACEGVCAKHPNIKGCQVVVTPAPENDECKKTPEERECCKEKTAECLACRACKPVTEYCAPAANRAVTGCDEVCCELGCSEQCKNVHHTTIKVERQCKWKVINQQFEAFRPTLLQANVENSCPFMSNYELHLESCQACARLHQPCNDTYIACGGCCGTPWHALLGVAVHTNHKCDEIKHYFAKRNSAVVACEEANETNKDEPAGDVGMVVHNSTEEVIDEGTLNSTCETNVTRLECKKIPFVLKFECDDCGNKGTPDLLDQCCDKCIEWSKSLENHPNIDKDIMPYVWCSGCDATEIKPLNPIFPPMPWLNADKYATHTEDKAYAAVDKYLEEEVCGALPETCPATTTTPTTTAPPVFLAATSKAAATTTSEATSDQCMEDDGKCFIAADGKWMPDDVPPYIGCLNECCQDFNSKRFIQGITCEDLDQKHGIECDTMMDSLGLRHIPPGTKMSDLCSSYCKECKKPAASTSTTADDDCYAENGGTCASHDFPDLVVNVCTDPLFPFQNTNPDRPQFCYSSKAFADARSGPCDSWCSLTTGGPTDNDGCAGCCGDFDIKKCAAVGGRRMQSPSKEYLAWQDADISCEQFDFAFYDRAKPKNTAAESSIKITSGTDKPEPSTTVATTTMLTEADSGNPLAPGFVALFALLWTCPR